MKLPSYMQAQTEWVMHTEYPDLRGHDEIAIDLETKDTDLNVDKDEIEDANWFDISQLKDLTHPDITDGFKLPRSDSIARRLVNDRMRRHE